MVGKINQSGSRPNWQNVFAQTITQYQPEDQTFS